MDKKVNRCEAIMKTWLVFYWFKASYFRFQNKIDNPIEEKRILLLIGLVSINSDKYVWQCMKLLFLFYWMAYWEFGHFTKRFLVNLVSTWIFKNKKITLKYEIFKIFIQSPDPAGFWILKLIRRFWMAAQQLIRIQTK